MGWLVLLYLLITEGPRLLRAERGDTRPIIEEARGLIEASQPPGDGGPDGFEILKPALDSIAALPRSDINFHSLWLGGDDEQSRLDRSLATSSLLQLERDGVFTRVTEASKKARAIAVYDAGTMPLLDLGQLGSMRHLVRACRARMSLALPDGGRAYVEMAEGGLGIARIAALQQTAVMRLLAIAVSQLVVSEIQESLVAERLSAETCVGLLQAIDRQDDYPARVLIVRMMELDFAYIVQTIFTDNGKGDGYPIPSQCDMMTRVIDMKEDDFWPAGPEWMEEIEIPGHDLLGVIYAPKRETLAAATGYFDGIERLAEVRGHAARQAMFSTDEYLDALGRGHSITRRLIRLIDGGAWNMLLSEDSREAGIAATRIMLALRLFDLEYDQYPERLAELAPAYLPEIPGDAVSGGEFVYRRLAQTQDEQGRGYLLYSVGVDGEDNGGNMSRENSALSPRRGRGFDHVFNMPRAWREQD